jgi:sugar O-acyltransferase (sialic acid O-acetyltransferase NeuD family)
MIDFKNKKKLVIVGIDNFGKFAYEYFSRDSDYEIVGFVPERPSIVQEFFGLPVIPFEQMTTFYPPTEYYAFAAIGFGSLNRRRFELYQRLKSHGYRLASYISSSVLLLPSVTIGENVIVLPNTVLTPFVHIGNNVLIMGGNYLGPGVEIEDNCYIAPGSVILEEAKIGKNSFLGANATIANDVVIAEDNFIGMSAVINNSTKNNEVYRTRGAILSKVSAKKFRRVEG